MSELYPVSREEYLKRFTCAVCGERRPVPLMARDCEARHAQPGDEPVDDREASELA
jgi:hypothetical protein